MEVCDVRTDLFTGFGKCRFACSQTDGSVDGTVPFSARKKYHVRVYKKLKRTKTLQELMDENREAISRMERKEYVYAFMSFLDTERQLTGALVDFGYEMKRK